MFLFFFCFLRQYLFIQPPTSCDKQEEKILFSFEGFTFVFYISLIDEKIDLACHQSVTHSQPQNSDWLTDYWLWQSMMSYVIERWCGGGGGGGQGELRTFNPIDDLDVHLFIVTFPPWTCLILLPPSSIPPSIQLISLCLGSLKLNTQKGGQVVLFF